MQKKTDVLKWNSKRMPVCFDEGVERVKMLQRI